MGAFLDEVGESRIPNRGRIGGGSRIVRHGTVDRIGRIGNRADRSGHNFLLQVADDLIDGAVAVEIGLVHVRAGIGDQPAGNGVGEHGQHHHREQHHKAEDDDQGGPRP